MSPRKIRAGGVSAQRIENVAPAPEPVGEPERPRVDLATRFRIWTENVASSVKVYFRERAAAIFIIGVLPMLVTVANSSWIYTQPGFIDAWVNFGYFQHLAIYKSLIFPNLYYGSRLPWILPGYLVYRLFTPDIANYVLHFAFYYAAAFSLYSLLKRAAGPRNALLGTVLFGTYAGFLTSTGRDYVDGAGMTYFLVALAAAARATESRRQLWLLVSGIAGLAMVYTNLFLVAYLPFIPGLYLFMMIRGFQWKSLWATIDVIVWFGMGGILLSALLGGINYRLDRHFWFYWPSIYASLGFRALPNPWIAHGWDWLHRATWLGIPAAATAACLAYVLRGAARGRTFRTYFVFQFVAIVAGMVAWQVVASTGLYWSYYASYMIPAMFLAVGCLLSDETHEPPPIVWWAFVGCSIAVLVLSTYMANGGLAHALRSKVSLLTATTLAAVGLLANVVISRKWLVTVAAVAGLAIYQLPYGGYDGRSPNHETDWRNIVEGVGAVWPYEEKSRPVFFWYNVDAPHGRALYSVNAAYLWGYSYIGTRFPQVEVPSRLVPGATIVMDADSDHWVRLANDALASKHLRGTLTGTYSVGRQPSGFKLGFLKLEADSAAGYGR